MKGKMVVQEGDGDSIPSSPLSVDSLNTKTGLPFIAGLSLENETDMNADEYGVQYCEICFEATQRTSTFVILEGSHVLSHFTLLPILRLLLVLYYICLQLCV